MGRLEGRTAIVTGGASGIGEATVKLFIEEGCNVVIADRNEAMGNALAAQLGDRAHFMELDVRSEDDWKRVVSGTVAAFGGLNILVNCAGYGIMTNIETTTLDQWHEMFAVHADGAFLGASQPSEALAWRPGRSGELDVSVVDDQGATATRRIRVAIAP